MFVQFINSRCSQYKSGRDGLLRIDDTGVFVPICSHGFKDPDVVYVKIVFMIGNSGR